MSSDGEVPRPEALVGWLLEHSDLQLPELSDSDQSSGSEMDLVSDSDSEQEQGQLEVGTGYWGSIKSLDLPQHAWISQ